MTPTNHRQAERFLIAMVHDGKWSIDGDGRIWRAGTIERIERLHRDGYLTVRAMRGGRRVTGFAHRLVWQALHGDIPDGMVVNHVNGMKADNRPANLEVVTYSANTSHAHRLRLRDQRGEGNPAAKLTNRDVAAIRAMYTGGGWTYATLGVRFGVAFQTIAKIVKGDRRATQGGPVLAGDLRHNVCDRDQVTQRFVARADRPTSNDRATGAR